ncbi:MAG: hypothetical protein AMJ42_03340 [Deltaproteobacteria bacterium DG_8]|nr:MAG: hypothetical protein AMJ42_03340 [Deltaproteobacteria bacterium DG_8]
MKSLFPVFSLFIILLNLSLQPAYGAEENGEKGCFVVTGHIFKRRVEIGVDQEFLENGIPFINRINPDFLILTGDLIRHPKVKIREQYDFVVQHVFNKIETRIYCVAGNHDTGWLPCTPAIEIFEKLFNPIHFSFEHKGSLFLFLSLYHPFPHIESSGFYFPLKRVWDEYDTPASRAFLDNLHSKLKGRYDHIFIFVHISPISDYPIGYYWSQFIIPLLSSLKEDIHIFSTDHFIRIPLFYEESRVVKYNNIRFYSFANFPRGSYIVHFDNHNVRVDLLQGSDFTPVSIQEIDFQPTNRLSMLKHYISILYNGYFRGKKNLLYDLWFVLH